MAKTKVLTPEQLAKRQEKEAKELLRLRKEQSKPKWPGYLIYFIFIITVIYVVDEITSQIETQMQSIIASQIFAPVVGEEFAVARLSVFATIASFGGMLAIIYKPLSDRYGRKLFLIINTLGMGLGMFLVSIATNIPTYVIGAIIIQFFIPNDMQATYIYESTPAKHRGKIYSVIKSLATFGILLVPILRNAFITPTDMSGWRMVYMIPSFVAIGIGLAAFFLIRESDAFLESRIRQLTMTEEEKEEAKAKKQDVGANAGIVSGLKFLFSHKQLRNLTIAKGLCFVARVITSYYEVLMVTGYAQKLMADGMGSDVAKLEATTLVSMALLVFPIGSAIVQVLQGFLADFIGRKKAAVVMASASLLSFLGFYLGSSQGWNVYLVGALAGTAVGSYWSVGDIITLMLTESTPTTIRSSVGAVFPLASGLFAIIGMVGFTVLFNILGDAFLGLLVLLFAIPGLGGGALLILFKTKETNGVNLGDIRGDEFEN